MRYSERKRLYLSLGIESAEAETEVNPNDFNEAETLAANEIENVSEIKDLSTDTEQLDDFAGATETAVELNAAVEAAVSSGKGLSRIEAAALTKALQASVGRYVTIENNLVPAVESYDIAAYDGKTSAGETNNKEQTAAAKKGIKAGIKAFIDAIIKKIKAIINAAKGFFKKIYDRLTLSFKRVNAINEKLSKIEYFGEYKTKYNAVNIHMEGGYTPDKYAESIMTLLSVVIKIASGEVSKSDQEIKFLADGIEAIKKADIGVWEKIRISLRAYLATSFSSLLENKISKKDDGTVVSETFPGGKRLVFSPGNDTGTNQLPSISFQRTDKPEGDPVVEIALPDRDTFKGLLQASIATLNAAISHKGRLNSFVSSYDEIIKKLDAGNLSSDAKIEGNKEVLTSISMFISSNTALRSKMLWFGVDQISTICQMADLAFKLNDESKSGKDQKEDAKTA